MIRTVSRPRIGPFVPRPREEAPAASGGVVRGISSVVLLDARAGTATKAYRRHPIVALLYWIAFQATFPYIANLAALRAAQLRRRIAGLVTQYALGQNAVAPIIRIERQFGRYALVSQLVQGDRPADNRRARAFLKLVSEAFIKSGLPTWQVSSLNPRATGNLIESADGRLTIIDLESNVVSPLVPFSGFWGALRSGQVPAFDEINVARLRSYIAERDQQLRAALGEHDYRALVTATNRYDILQRAWQGRELRLPARIVRFLTAVIDIPSHVRAVRRTVSKWSAAGAMAESWIRSGIDQWQTEGRIDGQRAAEAEAALLQPGTMSALTNLGAHLAMSIPLRFPFGSIVRFIWVIVARVRAEVRFLIRRKVDDETRSARQVHTLLVAFASALPGIGGFAYILAAPLRRNRLLLAITTDMALRKSPFQLYRRWRLAIVGKWLGKAAGLPTHNPAPAVTANSYPEITGA